MLARAGGSSFDGRRFDGKASKMKVLQRWLHYKDDPVYQALFDAEVFELSEAIFGTIPGTESLLSKDQVNRAG